MQRQGRPCRLGWRHRRCGLFRCGWGRWAVPRFRRPSPVRGVCSGFAAKEGPIAQGRAGKREGRQVRKDAYRAGGSGTCARMRIGPGAAGRAHGSAWHRGLRQQGMMRDRRASRPEGSGRGARLPECRSKTDRACASRRSRRWRAVQAADKRHPYDATRRGYRRSIPPARRCGNSRLTKFSAAAAATSPAARSAPVAARAFLHRPISSDPAPHRRRTSPGAPDRCRRRSAVRSSNPGRAWAAGSARRARAGRR